MAYWDVVTGRQTWSDYVTAQDQSRAFGNAIQVQTKALTKSNAQIALTQRDYQIALQSGLGALDESMSRDLGSLTSTIELGFDRLQNGIDGLNADFNLMMGDVIWKLEVQNEILASILRTLQAPLDTQAKELRQRAEDAYMNGWYDEALQDFLESERKNYQDFAVHRSIGNIHLYHVVDLPKALEYFLRAAKYARPRDARQAAEAEYFAGIVCSVQRNMKGASAHMLEATDLNPNLYEAFYVHAEFEVMLNDPAIAVRSLEKAIRGDARYHERAKTAEAFDSARPQVHSLLDDLMREIREKARRANKTIKELHGRCDNLLSEDKLKFAQLLDNGETQLAQAETYNDYYQFLFVPEHIEPELRIAEQRRDGRIRLDQDQIDGLDQKISEQNNAIGSGWKLVGIALAILFALFLAAEGCAQLANANRPSFGYTPGFGQFLGGLFGSLGAVIFILAFWAGVIIVLGMVIWQIGSTGAALIRIAKLKTEIAHCEASRWKRPRS